MSDDYPTPPQVDIRPTEDIAFVINSSGTTGPRKAVLLTHYNFVANILQQRWAMFMYDITRYCVGGCVCVYVGVDLCRRLLYMMYTNVDVDIAATTSTGRDTGTVTHIHVGLLYVRMHRR